MAFCPLFIPMQGTFHSQGVIADTLILFAAFWAKMPFCYHFFICCHNTTNPLHKGLSSGVWQYGSKFSKINYLLSDKRHLTGTNLGFELNKSRI